MGAVASIVGSEVSRRKVPFLALVIVVAVVVAVVAGGVAGARRTASVVNRFRDRQVTSDVVVRAFSPDLGTDPEAGVRLGDALLRVDGVTGASVGVGFPVEAAPPEYFMVYASPDGRLHRRTDRPVVREGRLPRADAPDEIAVNEQAVEHMGLRIGDEVSGPTLAHGAAEQVFGPEGTFPGFVGPTLTLRVVGIVTLPADVSGRAAIAGPEAVASPAFVHAYGPLIDSYSTFVYLQTAGEPSPELVSRVVESAGEEVGDHEVNVLTTGALWADSLSTTVRTVAWTILVISAFLAVAGLLVVAQWVRREVLIAGSQDATLRALGMSRLDRVITAAGPSLIAIAVGAVLGSAGAVALSGWFPIGLARSAEVEPGWRPDPVLLLVGAAVASALIAVAALAGRGLTRHRSTNRRTIRRASSFLARLGVRPPVALGVGLALDSDRGPRAVPARSAALAAIVAMAGLTAVLVVGSSADAVVDEPARYGWTWSSMPDVLTDDEDTLVERTMATDGVDGIAEIRFTQVGWRGQPEPAMSFDVRGGDVHLAVLDGRGPVDLDEVAVSQAFANEHGIAIGDTVDVDDPSGGAPSSLEVVGLVVGPMIDDESRALVLTPDSLDRFAQTEPSEYPAIRYAGPADPSRVEQDLSEVGFRFTETTRPQPPAEVLQFRNVRPLFTAVLVLVALLGGAGISHVLAVSVRRRRVDFAVLRAMGFVRRDVRRAVAAQASASTFIGIVVGVPVGVVVAMTLWRMAVERLGIVDTASLPWIALGAVAALALGGSLVIAVVLGRSAGRRPIAATLRSE